MADVHDLVTYTILVEGKAIATEIPIISIEVNKAVNKIPNAKILIADGGVSEDTGFEISETDDFKPGKEIEIKVGYNVKEKTIFKGIIVKHGIRVKNTSTETVIECKDKAVKMTLGRKNKIFIDKKDNEIINEVCKPYSLSPTVKATSVKHNEMVQHYTSDWDFTLLRAEANGMIVIANDGKLTIEPPKIASGLKVEYSNNLLTLNASFDSSGQIKKATGFAWDMGSQKLIKSSGKAFSDKIGGDWDTAALSKVFALDDYVLQTPAATTQTELQNWASSKLAKSALSKLVGNVVFLGDASVIPGTCITLAGLNKHFNGNAFVGAVNHTIAEGTWYTDVQLGMDFQWYHEETKNLEYPSTSGLYSSIKGLHIGKVMQIDKDKEGQFRVKVSIPTLQKDSDGVWARLTSPYASSEFGIFFYPEIDDEVIVGFINETPQNPIILGSVHSKKIKPPITPTKDNPQKMIKTKGELTVTFDDKDKIITIETPGKNIITLDDKAGKITLVDKNKNKIEMSSAGIVIDSVKDIKMTAKAKISIEGKAGIEIKSPADVKVEGLAIDIKAQTKLSAQAQAMAELKGSGTVMIKGGMVMIN